MQFDNPGDTVDNGTVFWHDDRKVVELGVLTLKTAVVDSKQAEKTIMFNPLLLPDGIAASNDPILLARPAAYAVSYGRRLAP